MNRQRTYQVKEVAELSGVSVRALHHYDEIGLLVPKGRTDAGYRLYDDQDLLRLQQIFIGRELGLSLEQIRRSLDDPSVDRKALLRQQRKSLRERAEQAQAMLRAVDRALALIEGETMDMKRIFDGFEPSKYEAEAEQRWGNSDAFRESKRRTQSNGKKTGNAWPTSSHESTLTPSNCCAPAQRRATPPRSKPPSGIGNSSSVGSIPAATPCTSASRRCTSKTRASPRTSTKIGRGLPRF